MQRLDYRPSSAPSAAANSASRQRFFGRASALCTLVFLASSACAPDPASSGRGAEEVEADDVESSPDVPDTDHTDGGLFDVELDEPAPEEVVETDDVERDADVTIAEVRDADVPDDGGPEEVDLETGVVDAVDAIDVDAQPDTLDAEVDLIDVADVGDVSEVPEVDVATDTEEDIEEPEENPCVDEDGEPIGAGVENACGGCEEIDVEIDDPCGPCGLDRWVCDSEDEVICDGETVANICGGCTPFGGEIDAVCGACDTGVWSCVDGDIACEGDLGEAVLNRCGECASHLDCVPGSLALGGSCGACGQLGQICGSDCRWQEWECIEVTECTPTNERVITEPCGECGEGIRSKPQFCTWGCVWEDDEDWSECVIETPCEPGGG